jgi:hypothetical protein
MVAAIDQNLDDVPDAIDQAPNETVGGTVIEIYAKIKKGIGDYFGLTPLPYDDPYLTGTFQGNGLNNGASYRRNIGGFRVASYKFISKTTFSIEEEYYDKDLGIYVQAPKNFRTLSIGLPKGHSVNEVVSWTLQWQNTDNIAGMVTPSGRKVDMTIASSDLN